MAGLTSKFLHGATLEIVIDDPSTGGTFTMAYAQAISFSHNMRNLPVGGIGAYGQGLLLQRGQTCVIALCHVATEGLFVLGCSGFFFAIDVATKAGAIALGLDIFKRSLDLILGLAQVRENCR